MPSVKIKFNEIESINIIDIDGGITANNIVSQYRPDAFINLALYDMTSKENIVKLLDENIESGYLFSDKGIGVTSEGRPIWCSLAEAKTNPDITDYVSGAPVLVTEGKVNIDWGNKVSTQIQGKHIRSAVGISDNELILYTSSSSITLEALACNMIDLGCKYAINCDGGSSSHLQDGKTIYKNSVRANPTWLLVYKKREEEQMSNKKYKICLDAGHGGSDPGATSGKLYEKDINLKVVKAMEEYLKPYVDIVLTRDTDKTVSLEERANIANKANVDLFFSVHCNSSDNTAARGWRCYIVGKGGNAEKLAKRVEANVFTDTTLGLKNGGIRTANFYVLRETDAPAVLVENAFISNIDDRTKFLKSDFVLNYFAMSYSKAILERLGISTVIETTKENEDFNWALTVLEANGVITSSEYWKNNKDKVQYLEQLIINMGKYIEDNK